MQACFYSILLVLLLNFARQPPTLWLVFPEANQGGRNVTVCAGGGEVRVLRGDWSREQTNSGFPEFLIFGMLVPI